MLVGIAAVVQRLPFGWETGLNGPAVIAPHGNAVAMAFVVSAITYFPW